MDAIDHIRLATSFDAESIAAIYAPIVTTTAISFEEQAPDANEMDRRIAAICQNFPWLVAEDAEGISGYAYAGRHRARAAYRWSADVSAYVAPQARRRGVAGNLYAALLKILEVQGYYSAFAGVVIPNDASVALHHSVGFAPIGTYPNVGFKAGAWRDVLWFSRQLRDPSREPSEPRAFHSLRQEEIAAVLTSGRNDRSRR